MQDNDYAQIAKHFHEKLDDLQFGRPGDEARFFLVEEEPLDVGEMVSRRMLAIQLAFVLNRTLVLQPSEDLAYPDCYQPISSHSYDDIASIPASNASFDVEQFEKVVRFDFDAFWANERLRRFFYPWAPHEYTSLKCARLIFDGETLSRLHLREEIAAHVDKFKAKIDFGAPTVGLYLGNGNPLAPEPDAPMDQLLLDVAALCSEHGVGRVLVTGDRDVYEAELRTGADIEFVMATVDNAEPLAQLLELELLSSCEWIVGRVTADIPRIAAARIGRRTMRCDRHRLVSVEAEKHGLGRLFSRS